MKPVEALHAVLFVADAPAPLSQLALALDLTEGQVSQAIELLKERLEKDGVLQLVELAGGYQLSTRPEYAPVLARFLRPQKSRLSRSLMEVLAIIAYRQPATVTDIEQVRGVQSDYAVRALMERRLIEERGRKQTPGRPVLYGTSAEFLHQFKMKDLAELPPLETEIPALEPRKEEE